MTQADAPVQILYREARLDDLAELHGLSLSVRWPHRLEDWRTLLSVGQGFVALVDETVVGVTLYWPHGDAHATLGLVIVSPDFQGKRIGSELMTRTLAACGKRTVMLNATPEGAGLYARLGFVASGTVAQHQGATFSSTLYPLNEGDRLRPVTRADHDAIIALHSLASGMSRATVLPPYLEQSPGIALDRDGEIAGFALYRRFGRGHIIGPVVAPDLDHAKMLISHWLALNPGQFIRVDVAHHPALSAWLDAMGIMRVDTGQVMTLGTPPTVPAASPRTYTLINQALS